MKATIKTLKCLYSYLLYTLICHNQYVNGLAGGGRIDKGFNLLETASGFLPQGRIVQTAKETVKFSWSRMMAELAPQDKTGKYTRPSYGFDGVIGSSTFPDEPGRYHVYLGNPCPWCHRVRLALALRNIDPKTEIGYTILIDDPIKASRG